MNTEEEETIRAFICEPKRNRYLAKIASEKHRSKFLDCLNRNYNLLRARPTCALFG